MPELPEVLLYLHALEPRVVGYELERVRLRSPSLLKTWDPPLSAAHGTVVRGLRHVGKRIVFELDGELFLVVHPMIAGRFRWRDPGAKVPGRVGLAAFDFEHGTLVLTEASTKKRASLHLLRGASTRSRCRPTRSRPR